MRALQFFLGCIGRVLISLIFILAALQHMLNWQGSLTDLSGGLQSLSTQTIPLQEVLRPLIDYSLAHTQLLMGTAVIFMLLGGLLVFFGVKTRFGAFLLFLFIIPTTLIMHQFWNLQGAARELQMTMFMKNFSILGALIYLLAFGNGYCKTKKPSRPTSEEK